ncbi:TIR domain-containing protein [Sinorhizobium meliloti]|uniref:TIR domain-containing protein n=1 Tax=Rhizobium meliloti TaxID=382 RepID=UPI000FD91FE2|nr:nucleotide-binding protein [Sinorhizobium meliloti]RVM95932.1 hypothetical protein CN119_08010 [Sinorhizobium meliloti]
MKVATFGSWIDKREPPWKSLGDRAQFEAACRAIGQRIGELGHAIIVGSSRAHTADKHITEGFLNSGAAVRPTGSIIVIRPFNEVSEYAALSQNGSRYFRFSDRFGLRPEGVKALAVREADVVLTVGGAEGTYMAGLAAVMGSKPLIPIGSFGGASRELLKALRDFNGNTDLNTELDALGGPWNSYLLEDAFSLAGITKDAKPLRLLLIHGHSTDWQDLRHWLMDKIGARVIVMKDEFGDGRTLPEKFEQLAGGVDGAIALATPDDIGGLTGQSPDKFAVRARENVWLEFGWFWGRLGRRQVILLLKGGVQIPSDLAGLECYSYHNHPKEQYEQVREFLKHLRSERVIGSL